MEFQIRECQSLEELTACVQLQREVFALPELEISPVRHLIVTKHAGGFTLGAYQAEKLIGFVLSVPAFLDGQKAFYSHMTAVSADFQGTGIGARLKWAQRERALQAGVKFIKWTFQPVLARNAYFNLEKLGAMIKRYEANFYGTDYPAGNKKDGLDSDRLIAEWHLESPKVSALAEGTNFQEQKIPDKSIEIPVRWDELVKNNLTQAIAEQQRIKKEFEEAFAAGMVCRNFQRDKMHPKYLLTKI